MASPTTFLKGAIGGAEESDGSLLALATSEKRRRAAEPEKDEPYCGAAPCGRAVEGDPNSLRTRFRPWSRPERPAEEDGGGVVVREDDPETDPRGGLEEERRVESTRGDPGRPVPSMAVAEERWVDLSCAEEVVDSGLRAQ